MATINGRKLLHPKPFKPPISKIIGGTGIDVQSHYNGDTVISTIAPYPPTVTKITGGPGIIVSDTGNGNILVQAHPPINFVPTSKPIFMIGLPSTTSPAEFEGIGRHLDTKLPDYHVLVLRNTTDTYTAKLFSERDSDTLPISDIKKYIDQKLK